MPAYEYICPFEDCDEHDVIQVVLKPMAQAGEPEECPACGRELERSYTDAPAGVVKQGTPRFHRRSM